MADESDFAIPMMPFRNTVGSGSIRDVFNGAGDGVWLAPRFSGAVVVPPSANTPGLFILRPREAFDGFVPAGVDDVEPAATAAEPAVPAAVVSAASLPFLTLALAGSRRLRPRFLSRFARRASLCDSCSARLFAFSSRRRSAASCAAFHCFFSSLSTTTTRPAAAAAFWTAFASRIVFFSWLRRVFRSARSFHASGNANVFGGDVPLFRFDAF